jgi:hypothetical protein
MIFWQLLAEEIAVCSDNYTNNSTVADPGGPGGPWPPKRYERNFFSNEPLDNVVGNVKIFSARFARNYSTHIQYKAVLNLSDLVMIF